MVSPRPNHPTIRPASAKRRLLATGAALIGLLLGGCVAPVLTVPVPESLVTHATVPGYSSVRYGYDHTEAEFVADFQLAMRSAPPGPDGVSVLALSGGGANGAFCAGVLCGWTESGQRPTFQVVTGVSTGALAAPFAFLGSAYDTRLIEAYANVNDRDVFLPHIVRSAFRLFREDSLAETTPLARRLAELVDQPMLEAIAVEHRRGRRLYVCTTELTSGRAVFWNLSAIAASGRPDARTLFLKVLIASASIPIVFPPQYFDVVADNRTYTEMHVDGGLSRQVFIHLHGARAGLTPLPDATPRPLTAYIICNSKIKPSYDAIRPAIMPIAMRTVHALIHAEAVGDLHRIHEQTVTEGAGFRLAAIPDDFPLQHHGTFDAAFMKNLFDLGRSLSRNGSAWQGRPPLIGVSQ